MPETAPPATAPAATATTPTAPAAPSEPTAEAKTKEPPPATPAATPSTEAPRIDLAAMGDHLVELEIDGQKELVPLKDAVASGRIQRAAHKRFAEAAEIRKQAQQDMAALDRFTEAVESDPVGVIRRYLGEKWDAMLDAEVSRRAKYQAMTPEERAQHDHAERERALREREARLGEREKRTEAERAEADLRARAEKVRPAIEQAIAGAIGKAGLPDVPQVRRLVVGACRDWIDQGRPLTQEALEHIVGVVRKEHEGLTSTGLETRKAALAKLEGDALLAETERLLGADVLGRLRTAEVERIKRAQGAEQRSAGAASPAPAPAAPRPGVRKSLDEIMRGRGVG